MSKILNKALTKVPAFSIATCNSNRDLALIGHSLGTIYINKAISEPPSYITAQNRDTTPTIYGNACLGNR